jgi:hypothetical protein
LSCCVWRVDTFRVSAAAAHLCEVSLQLPRAAPRNVIYRARRQF